MVTGVFLAFRINVIVTLVGIVTVVKLKTPLAGSCTDCEVVGAKAPSAPVEPLLKLVEVPWAPAVRGANGTRSNAVRQEVNATRIR
jgi:hypothetical protein